MTSNFVMWSILLHDFCNAGDKYDHVLLVLRCLCLLLILYLVIRCNEVMMLLAFIGKLGCMSDWTPDHLHHRSATDFKLKEKSIINLTLEYVMLPQREKEQWWRLVRCPGPLLWGFTILQVTAVWLYPETYLIKNIFYSIRLTEWVEKLLPNIIPLA